MTFQEFDEFSTRLIEECFKMRDTKGVEYASGASRFGNFDRLAASLEIPRGKVAMIYLQKHLDSVNTYYKTGKIYSDEHIRGRFVDAITYLMLMAGMAEEDARLSQDLEGGVLSPERLEPEFCLCTQTTDTGHISRCVYPFGHSGKCKYLPVTMDNPIKEEIADSITVHTSILDAKPECRLTHTFLNDPNRKVYYCAYPDGHLGKCSWDTLCMHTLNTEIGVLHCQYLMGHPYKCKFEKLCP